MKRSLPWLLALGLGLPAGQLGCSSSSSSGATGVPAGTAEFSIASGDTTETSAVLWARVVVPGPVLFVVSTEPTFINPANEVFRETTLVADVLKPATVVTRDEDGEGVLIPGVQYFFRVTQPDGQRLTGQFRTLDPNRTTVRFGVTGDWRGELSPYPSVRNVPERDLDFFVTLGDSIYADSASPFVDKPAAEVQFRAVGAETLAEFRLKHSEVYARRFGLNTLADLRRLTAWYGTIDDHELANDFAGAERVERATDDDDRRPESPRLPLVFVDGVDEGDGKYVNQLQIYADAMQAFQEYHAIDPQVYADTDGDERTEGKPKLYRTWQSGDATFFLLDLRSFRSEPVDPVSSFDAQSLIGFYVGAASSTDTHDEPRTMMGLTQLSEFVSDLESAETTWKFVFSSLTMQRAGPIAVGEDRWDGYLFEREFIMRAIDGAFSESPIPNVVFITGDIHGTLVNNVTSGLIPGQLSGALGAFPDEIFSDQGGPFLSDDEFDRVVPSCWEISTGSVGYEPSLGLDLVEQAAALGFLSAGELAAYSSLQHAEQRDAFVKGIFEGLSESFFFDQLGLSSTLSPDPEPEDPSEVNNAGIRFIPTAVSQGGDVFVGDHTLAVHYFGWTEFEVQADRTLLVTTWGVDAYNEAELIANPDEVSGREPRIVQRFRVRPALGLAQENGGNGLEVVDGPN